MRVYRVLLIFFLLLVLIIIAGTLYWAFSGNRPPPGHIAFSQGNTEERGQGQGQVFNGIGQIRVSTADPQPGMVILFVSFNYNPDDRAFSEELALRIRDFREIVVNYFGSLSVSELRSLSEDNIKAELLLRFNAVLRLGRIDALFFTEFMVLG